jgi:glutaredoxin-like YruB-family protein
MAHAITIYSTPTCPYCKMAKNFLKEENIAFNDVDVSTDEKLAQEMIDKSGQLGVPVIDIDGKIIVGFDKTAMKEALGLK